MGPRGREEEVIGIGIMGREGRRVWVCGGVDILVAVVIVGVCGVVRKLERKCERLVV